MITTTLALLAVLASPQNQPMTARAGDTKLALCMMNGKQLALGALMFCADHDNKLAISNANYKTKLFPYLKNKELITCPLDKKGATSYTLNPAMAGVSLAKVKRPDMTVLFFEGKGKALNFRHGGKAVVVFCDGHVKTYDSTAAKRLIWKP